MSTYVVELRHYLDEAGEIVTDMPPEARQLASFFALIVDEASGGTLLKVLNLSVRCRGEGCAAKIRARCELPDELLWQCPTCDNSGIIRNWSGTKWDRSQG